MYIMITTKCNMTCGHCCNYYQNPEDMKYSTFIKILKRWGPTLYKKYGRICLGGGEPTVHPEFWKFLLSTMAYGLPWLATNGKKTEDCLLLAKLAKLGKISACLSLDEWHDPISEDVIKEFKEGLVKRENGTGWRSADVKTQGRRQIQTITNKFLFKAGRSKIGRTICHCKHVRVFPNGIITGCACEDAPIIGTVEDGIYEKYSKIPLQTSCSRNWELGEDGYYRVKCTYK